MGQASSSCFFLSWIYFFPSNKVTLIDVRQSLSLKLFWVSKYSVKNLKPGTHLFRAYNKRPSTLCHRVFDKRPHASCGQKRTSKLRSNCDLLRNDWSRVAASEQDGEGQRLKDFFQKDFRIWVTRAAFKVSLSSVRDPETQMLKISTTEGQQVFHLSFLELVSVGGLLPFMLKPLMSLSSSPSPRTLLSVHWWDR